MRQTSGTASTNATTTTVWSGWRKVPQKPSRVAVIVMDAMDRLCELSGHFGACALLNGRIYVHPDADESRVIPLPLTWRLWRWASDNASDWRFERWEP